MRPTKPRRAREPLGTNLEPSWTSPDPNLVELTPERFRELIVAARAADVPPPPVARAFPNWAA